MTLRVAGRKQFPLVLRDQNGTEMGLILCDRKGNPLPTTISQSSSPNSVLRISQGAPGYSDFELPYTPVLQDSWVGGRGAKDFESGTTRYSESEGVDTANGRITLGPAPVTIANNIAWVSNHSVGTASAEYQWQTMTAPDYLASRFTFAGAYRIRTVKVRFRALSIGTFRVVIWNESAGLPGTIVARSKAITITNYSPDGGISFGDMVEYNVPISASLTTGNYYIGIECSYNTLRVDTRTGSSIGSLYNYVGPSWAGTADQVLKVQYSYDGTGVSWFFDYHGLTYVVKNFDDGTGVEVFRNGLHEYALAGCTTEEIKTPWNLSGLNLAGKKLRILSGTGSTQTSTWRTIMSNTQTGTNDTIYLNPADAFEVAPDMTSEIVVQGMDKMFVIASHGLTKITGQPIVANNFVYFPQGSATNIRKMRLNLAVHEWADDGTNKADLAILCPKTTGGYQMWTADISTGMVYSADLVTVWATALTFAASNDGKPVSVSGAQITGMVPYGTPTIPYILKEDGFGNINNGIYSDMPINNMIEKMRSRVNGRVVAVSDIYLFFSMVGGRLERYYDQHLDDVGVDRDEGLPANQQGEVTSILTLPGRLFISVNAGELGYSAIYQNNGQGWHEYYRAPLGGRIRKIAYQNIEGGVSRILVSQEESVVALHYSTKPTETSGYLYQTSGWLRSARIFGSMRDVRKFFKSATLFSEGLVGVGGYTSVRVQYRTDENQTWQDAVKLLETSMIDKTDLSVANDVSGRWFEYKLILRGKTSNNTLTPEVDAVLLDGITRVPPKEGWTLYFLLDDTLRDYSGLSVKKTVQDYMEQLRAWSDSRETPCPLTMISTIPAFNNKMVVIDPGSFVPLEIQEIGMSGEIIRTRMLGQIRVMAV